MAAAIGHDKKLLARMRTREEDHVAASSTFRMTRRLGQLQWPPFGQSNPEEPPMIHRRDFFRASVACTAALAASPLLAAEDKKPKLKKAVKYAMIGGNAPIKEKFELVKSLGFQGVEFDSPSNINKDEALKAQETTGIKIHGVIDSVHWSKPLSDPHPGVRAIGLAALCGALVDAGLYGADDVLLVPGVVNKEVTYEQCWERSHAEIEKAIPLAQKLGVKIAIEVVWNNFITKPEQFVEYIDSFKTPVVGGYFDCSNMVKYGVKSGDWIRKLGNRMVKFDFKGFSKTKFDKGEKDYWVPIGEGDEDWPDIVKALGEIGYDGWVTAEVGTGGRDYLKDVAERMNRVLQLN
jgi:hexulose-6-phosphate isomerase